MTESLFEIDNPTELSEAEIFQAHTEAGLLVGEKLIDYARKAFKNPIPIIALGMLAASAALTKKGGVLSRKSFTELAGNYFDIVTMTEIRRKK